MGKFRLIDHTADLGIELSGESLDDLFMTAGRALAAQIAVLDHVAPAREYEIAIQGLDYSDLLIKWMKEILSLYHLQKFLTCEVEIKKLSPTNLTARIRGERYDPGKHELQGEIKAITYHQAEIRKTEGGYRITVIMDT